MRKRDEDEISDGGADAGGRWRALTARAVSLIGRRPLDVAAGVVAVGLASGTVANALFLQSGPHPAPLLMTAAVEPAPVKDAAPRETTGSVVASAPAQPAAEPAPAPVAARTEPAPKRTQAQLITELQRELARRGFYDGPIDGLPGPRLDAAMRKFEQSAGMKPNGKPTEAMLTAVKRAAVKQAGTAKPAAVPAKRVTAVQRALTEFGYGQLKLSGVVDAPTRKAIEKFERERKLPVKGEVSDRLLRELAAATGRTL